MRYTERYTVVDVMRTGLVGHAVLDTEGGKFTSLNLFSRDEAVHAAAQQNEAAHIKAHWPPVDDPAVKMVLQSPEFTLDETMTTAYALHRASEVVARSRAGLPA